MKLSFPLIGVVLAMLLNVGLFAQQDQTITITSGGVQRTFDVHLPSAAPPSNLPVLLCYHGTGGTSESMKSTTGFNTLADQYNFIVVYPQSLQIGNDLQWNVYVDDKPGHAGVSVADAPNDVEFTRDIINNLMTTYTVDTKRVFASGLSNGGFMCYALSMLAHDDIAAIAPVAANMWGDETYLNQLVGSGTVKPMPVMHVHGTVDNVVGYPDPDNTPKDYEEYPLFISSRACNALTYSKVLPIMNNVDKLVFCPAPVEVSLIRIQGMGHAWTNGAYSTSTEIVKFFGLDNGTSAVAKTPVFEFSIEPNPANTSLRVELAVDATLQMISSLGTIIYSAAHSAGFAEIPCGDLPGGIYLMRILPANGTEPVTKQVVVVH